MVPGPGEQRPPAVPGWALDRPRLLGLLEQVAVPLVVLRAPAGYGKTLLAAQWLRAQPTARWCDLSVEPDREALPELAAADVPLILDNYRPGLQAVDECLAELLERRRAAVLLACRAEPGLELPRWRLEELVLELGADDLAFTSAEVKALLMSMLGHLSEEAVVAEVMRRTEGWPVAVRLAGKLLAEAVSEAAEEEMPPEGDRSAPGADALVALSGALPPLAEYLEAEVLAPLPEDARELLLIAAVFGEVVPAWCDAALEVSGSAARLRRLRLGGVPLRAPQRRGDSYRLHPHLREFLRAQLAEQPALRRRLEERAAQVLCQERRTLEAIPHALAAEEWELALQCLDRSSDRAFREGRGEVVREALRRLPADYRRRPEARRIEGYLAWATGDHALALARAQEASAAADLDVRAAGYVLEAAIHYARGQLERELEALAAARAQQPHDSLLRAKVSYLLGAALARGLRLEEAEVALHEAERSVTEGDPVHLAVVGHLPLLQLARGRPRAALRGLERALRAARNADSRRSEAHVLYHLALASNQLGQHRRAREALRVAERLCEALELAYLGALVRRELADTLRELGEEALEAYREAIAAFEGLGAAAGLLYAHHGLAVLYRRRGEPAAARREAERALAHGEASDPDFVALVRVHAAHLEGDVVGAREALAALRRFPQRYYLAQALLYAAATEPTGSAAARVLLDEALELVRDAGFEHLLRLEETLLARVGEEGASSVAARTGFRLQLFGEPQLRDPEGAPVLLRPQALELLAYLALERGGTVDTEEVIEALWPGRPEGMRRALQTLVWMLRRALGREAILTRRRGYAFDPEGVVWVDVEAFVREVSARHYQAAVDLYRGELLPKVEWADLERRHLERQYLEALEGLAGERLAQGHLEEGMALLERVLALDPFAEAVVEKLIACQRATGREEAARRQRREFLRNLEQAFEGT